MYDELLTAKVEVECVKNSKPLTYISSDDTEEPLMPSHLLIGRRILGNCEEELPKKPVGRLSAVCRPSVGRLSAVCRPTVGRQALPEI